MTFYRYQGPPCAASLRQAMLGVSAREVPLTSSLLVPGAKVALPSSHPYTQTLLSLGHLIPFSEPKVMAPSPSKGGAA